MHFLGELPESIGQLVHLKELLLVYSKLTGADWSTYTLYDLIKKMLDLLLAGLITAYLRTH